MWSRAAVWMIPCVVACTPGGGGGDPDTDPVVEAGPCEALGMPTVAFQEGNGRRRREVFGDFTVPDQNGDWTLSDNWSGCETYLFIGDGWRLPSGESLWSSDDLDKLLRASPPNVHYFFVSQEKGASAVAERVALIGDQVDKALGKLDPGDAPGQADWWAERIHLVQKGSGALGRVGELVESLGGGGSFGFGIDRWQRLRGVGSIADNRRYNSSLEGWPYEDNFSFVANEARYYNMEATREGMLTALTNPTTVEVWQGEVLSEFAIATVDLPDAAAMAGFDTFVVDLGAYCPNADAQEFNNCGAWDYIANLFIEGETPDQWIEFARFITPYHREARYVVDLSSMLPLLGDGGTRRIRYSFAPPWNVQPTESYLTFLFSNEGKGARPVSATPLYTGGAFGPDYDALHPPMDVAVPAGAAKVELYAILTGHGMSEGDNCAEFCDHGHEFTINGTAFLRDHPETGDDQGCVGQIDAGAVPNQWGTWWFGRGGWCPGMAVAPWVVDVTEAAGSSAAVSYRGLYQGAAPTKGLGDIALSSWLITWE